MPVRGRSFAKGGQESHNLKRSPAADSLYMQRTVT
jgi:hypothetical protein